MSIFQKLWPGRPEPTPRGNMNSTVTDADVDTIINATSYINKGERVPADVLRDVHRVRRSTGFFLGDAMTLPENRGQQ
jgi:hypothetical protein